MEAANIYETFLGVRLCAKPSTIFSFYPHHHLRGWTPICRGRNRRTKGHRAGKWRGEGFEPRKQKPQRLQPQPWSPDLQYLWLFMEGHESINHFHSHELHQSPQSVTSHRELHQAIFGLFTKPAGKWSLARLTGDRPPVRGIFSVESGDRRVEICH